MEPYTCSGPLDLSQYMYYNEMRERLEPFPHFLILEEILHESST